MKEHSYYSADHFAIGKLEIFITELTQARKTMTGRSGAAKLSDFQRSCPAANHTSLQFRRILHEIPICASGMIRTKKRDRWRFLPEDTPIQASDAASP